MTQMMYIWRGRNSSERATYAFVIDVSKEHAYERLSKDHIMWVRPEQHEYLGELPIMPEILAGLGTRKDSYFQVLGPRE